MVANTAGVGFRDALFFVAVGVGDDLRDGGVGEGEDIREVFEPGFRGEVAAVVHVVGYDQGGTISAVACYWEAMRDPHEHLKVEVDFARGRPADMQSCSVF